MRRNNWFLLLLLWLSACGKGEFIPDPVDPRIPRYTESAHNAAGALINGQVWRAVKIPRFYTNPDREVLRLRLSEDSTQLYLSIQGQKLGGPSSDYYTDIEFVLDNSEGFHEDFFALEGKKFRLDGSSHYAHFGFRDYDPCLSKEGQLYTKNATKIGDQSTGVTQYILSGTFGFIIESEDCERTEVLHGRFDYAVAWPLL